MGLLCETCFSSLSVFFSHASFQGVFSFPIVLKFPVTSFVGLFSSIVCMLRGPFPSIPSGNFLKYFVGFFPLNYTLIYLFILGPHSQHMEVPRLGVESAL